MKAKKMIRKKKIEENHEIKSLEKIIREKGLKEMMAKLSREEKERKEEKIERKSKLRKDKEK